LISYLLQRDESQSEEQFYLQSLGENETGYCANICFHRWKP